ATRGSAARAGRSGRRGVEYVAGRPGSRHRAGYRPERGAGSYERDRTSQQGASGGHLLVLCSGDT
ncbi:hypothetical protein, partial [Halorubrum tibetense]